jgi:hemolysin activation/secretion protein
LHHKNSHETRRAGLTAVLIVAIASLIFSKDTFAASVPQTDSFFIGEYRVDGVRSLSRLKVEEAVYPFLGPERTQDDVEAARASLEKAYHDAGFQTVAVEIPRQSSSGGVIHMKVVERQVARLRVKGAKYTSPSRIKAMAPSLAEGKVINFNDVPRDIVALNQSPDSTVTPSLRADPSGDKVDVDLDVKDKAPLHASVEVDNRQAPDTKPLRLNASVSTSNLAGTGQSLGFSYQTSPQDPSQVEVFSGYYIERFARLPGFSLMLQGTRQDSNVSTLGDTAVAGKGSTAGLRAMFNLPSVEGFVQSASVGVDYKHFDQTINLGSSGTTAASSVATPITYYPISANYSATWQGKRSSTELNAGVTFNFQNLGSNSSQFDQSRYNSDGNFIYFKGDLTHTRDLPLGLQASAKVQGQISNQPLISQEQETGGGTGTVRGYLEAEAVGDSGLFGSLELRGPDMLKYFKAAKGDFRLFAFYDAGWLTVIDALPGQADHFDLASYGIGGRLRIGDHVSGSVTGAVPLIEQGQTKVDQARLLFQAAIDY